MSEKDKLLLTEGEIIPICQKYFKELLGEEIPKEHIILDFAYPLLEAQLVKVKQHYEQETSEYFEDGRRILMDFHQGEITGEEVLELILKLKPKWKRLDRPELREKIASIVEELGYDKYGCADQILALIEPLIEQRISQALEENTLSIIEEAKKQERERIWERWDESVKPLVTCSKGIEGYDKEWIRDFWQALKEEK